VLRVASALGVLRAVRARRAVWQVSLLSVRSPWEHDKAITQRGYTDMAGMSECDFLETLKAGSPHFISIGDRMLEKYRYKRQYKQAARK
jgi:hypothetical protein